MVALKLGYTMVALKLGYTMVALQLYRIYYGSS